MSNQKSKKNWASSQTMRNLRRGGHVTVVVLLNPPPFSHNDKMRKMMTNGCVWGYRDLVGTRSSRCMVTLPGVVEARASLDSLRGYLLYREHGETMRWWFKEVTPGLLYTGDTFKDF